MLVTYTLVKGVGTVRLDLRPLLHARPHEEPVDFPLPATPSVVARDHLIEVSFSPTIPLAADAAGAIHAAPLRWTR